MSSSTGIRGIRRKKSSLSEVKIAIIGAPGVGKSALAVRFLTKRYIGEYDHQSETRYKHEILVDGEPVLFEICDTCPRVERDMPLTETILWADGFILVYSITDRGSFNYVKLVKQYISDVKQQNYEKTGNTNSTGSSIPIVLLGNKGDMVHLRQVATEEGDILSKDFDCYFSEVAAADQVAEIAEAFLELCREVHISRRKNKTSLLNRVLGNKSGLRSYSRGKSDSVLSKD
eukprot:maker-scaffold143_size313727-snap-gene-1.29 protein:Tk09414 transcript:maker-scaffold143_size313727-snap-gene-1.29-mRNA-1 annotation:"ras-related and estrogen-regulated growth inhibitor-like"